MDFNICHETKQRWTDVLWSLSLTEAASLNNNDQNDKVGTESIIRFDWKNTFPQSMCNVHNRTTYWIFTKKNLGEIIFLSQMCHFWAISITKQYQQNSKNHEIVQTAHQLISKSCFFLEEISQQRLAAKGKIIYFFIFIIWKYIIENIENTKSYTIKP